MSTNRRRRLPSPATAIALVALFIALGGTALAATGQLVNIADPGNAANVAKVDATGALKTAGTSTVIPGTPRGTFQLQTWACPACSETVPFLRNSGATLALTDFGVTNSGDNTATIAIVIQQSSYTDGTCATGGRELARYVVPAGQTAGENRTTPVIVKPPTAGAKYCLIASAYKYGSGTANSSSRVTVSGWTILGTTPVSMSMSTSTAAAGEPQR